MRSLDASSLFRVLTLVWKCRDDEMLNRGTFMMDRIQNVFTTWTNQDCLAVLGGDDNDFSLRSAFNTLLFDGCINSTEYMELQSRSFFFEPDSRKNNKTANNKATDDGIDLKSQDLRLLQVDGNTDMTGADALPDTATRIVDFAKNVDQEDASPVICNLPVFGDRGSFVDFSEMPISFTDPVPRKRPKIDSVQVSDTEHDTPCWTLNPVVREAIEQHCDHISSICFGKVAQWIGNSLHFHDEWNPGNDGHFAIWSDIHSVSFIHTNDKAQCKPYDWFSNVPEFEQCRFAVWKDDTLCVDDSFPNPNCFVVCDARREDLGSLVRDLGKILQNENSCFIQNPLWTRLSFVDADLQHATLNMVWSWYQFATGRPIADAWGLQCLNLQVRFIERIVSQGHFDKWQANIYEEGITGDVVHCWVDHYWKDLIHRNVGKVCSIFGCGLIGFHSHIPKICVPSISKGVVMTFENQGPLIILRFLQRHWGMAEWQ